jgi:hypothetical protein
MKILSTYANALLLLFLPLSISIGAAERYDVPLGDCPSLGPENAPVTIIEFIDYQ